MPTKEDSRHFHNKNKNTDTDSQTNKIINHIDNSQHIIRPTEHIKKHRNYISHFVNPFTIKNNIAKSNRKNKQVSDNVNVSSCRTKIEPEEEPIIIKSPTNYQLFLSRSEQKFLIENLPNDISNKYR